MKRVRRARGGPYAVGWAGSETFHRYTARLPVRTARVRPSGAKSRERWPPSSGMNGLFRAMGCSGSRTFHSRTLPSRAAVARTRPSGRKAPLRPNMSEVGTDHSRTLLSPLPVARVRPSGLKPSAYISPLLPASGSPTWEG